MSTNTNLELLKFFKWWLQEAQSSRPVYEVQGWPLCSNAAAAVWGTKVHEPLKELLLAEYGTTDYPFGGVCTYKKEYRNDTFHLNPERIAFVKVQIERLEKLNV